MCLRTVDEKLSREQAMMLYKTVEIERFRGEITFQPLYFCNERMVFSREKIISFEIGVTLTDPHAGRRIKADSNQTYEAGFHCYVRRRDALRATARASSRAVLKVLATKIVVSGTDGVESSPTIIAQRILPLKVIWPKGARKATP